MGARFLRAYIKIILPTQYIQGLVVVGVEVNIGKFVDGNSR